MQPFAEEHTQVCPYCGEWVEVEAEPLGPGQEEYVEDCPVCCRPWVVHVRREGGEVLVTLGREDE
jgi:hypothetical protein